MIFREPSSCAGRGCAHSCRSPLLPPAAIYLLLTPKPGGGYIAYNDLTDKIHSCSTFSIIIASRSMPHASRPPCRDRLRFWQRWVRLHPAIAMPLSLLLLTYLLMPDQLATASGADGRIPLLLALLLVAGSCWTAPKKSAARAFMGAALARSRRVSAVGAEWLENDRFYAQLLPAFDQIPAGSRVAVANPSGTVDSPAPSICHFPALAVVRSNAFVPTGSPIRPNNQSPCAHITPLSRFSFRQSDYGQRSSSGRSRWMRLSELHCQYDLCDLRGTATLCRAAVNGAHAAFHNTTVCAGTD